jgi:hypothetical protein
MTAATAMVIWWVLIGQTGHKFSDELEVTGYATQDECVQAAKDRHWDQWACFTISLPEGQPFVVVNDS